MFKKTYELLKNNQRFILDLNPKLGDCSRVFLPHKEIFKSVKKNNKILIDDGKIKLNIEKVSSDQIITQVVNGGRISNRKGVNIPEKFYKNVISYTKRYYGLKIVLRS